MTEDNKKPTIEDVLKSIDKATDSIGQHIFSSVDRVDPLLISRCSFQELICDNRNMGAKAAEGGTIESSKVSNSIIQRSSSSTTRIPISYARMLFQYLQATSGQVRSTQEENESFAITRMDAYGQLVNQFKQIGALVTWLGEDPIKNTKEEK